MIDKEKYKHFFAPFYFVPKNSKTMTCFPKGAVEEMYKRSDFRSC